MLRNKLFLVFSLLLVPSVLFAVPKQKVNGKYMPGPGGFSASDVYISSNTCTEAASILISSRPALFHAVIVSTPGGAGSALTVYDGRHTGDIAGENLKVLTSSIATTGVAHLPYELGASSGIAVRNVGGACFSVIYTETW